jgi:hypothetical protein
MVPPTTTLVGFLEGPKVGLAEGIDVIGETLGKREGAAEVG